MKRSIFCFALAVLLMGWNISVSASFDSASRESVARVAIGLDMDVGTELISGGTGFFIGLDGEDPSYLITNYHVIENFVACNAGDLIQITLEDGTVATGRSKIRVYYDNADYDEAYLVDSNEQKDVAVLRLDNPTDKRKPLPLCSPTDSMVGSTVYAIGYPGLADNIIAGSTTSWGISDCTITKGSISRMFTTEGTGIRNIQIDCEIKHGNSGGPLVTEDNAVIGINTKGITDGSESFNYAINIDEVIPMLKLHDIEYELIDPSNPDPVDPDPITAPSYGLYIAIGVLAAVIVAAVLVFMKRKKEPAPKEPVNPPEPPAPQPVGTPVVKTMSGIQLRAVLSQKGQQILIGRDQAACSLVFPNKTPGVSGRHCSLSWDSLSASFILTDLQSTYGTYLENGQKLAPGVVCRLRPGERFYLGEKNNMLSVGLE